MSAFDGGAGGGRKKNFKKGVDTDDARRRREETSIQVRTTGSACLHFPPPAERAMPAQYSWTESGAGAAPDPVLRRWSEGMVAPS